MIPNEIPAQAFDNISISIETDGLKIELCKGKSPFVEHQRQECQYKGS